MANMENSKKGTMAFRYSRKEQAQCREVMGEVFGFKKWITPDKKQDVLK